jgi:GTP-binding protein EngB required for normal cell division
LILLNKSDKLSKNQSHSILGKIKKQVSGPSVYYEILTFSSKDLVGLSDLNRCLETLLLI